MTNGLSSPKAAHGPRTPEPAPDAARGAPPPSDAFAGILGDAQQARTATAEGQSPEKPAHGEDCAAPVESAAQVDTAVDTPTPDATAAAAVLAVLPVPVAVTPAAAPEAPATEVAPVAEVDAGAPVLAVATPAAAAEAVEQIVSVPAVPAAQEAPPTAPVVTATAPVVAQQQVAPEAPKPQAQPVAGSSAPTQQVGAPTTPQPGAQQQGQDGPLPQPTPKPPVAAQAQQAAPAAPTAPAAPPAEAARPAPLPTPIATPVPLARAAEAVEHVLRVVATRGGVTHARIALQPDSLGSVDVHIRSTAEGLVARVVAHTAEAVQTLQNAANDLRQSLEEQGLNLMSLDIGQPGERRAGDRAHEGGGHASPADDASAEAETTTTETLRLPTGVLVDVLA